MKQEVEVVMIFKVNEYNKTYMAYTTDDIMNTSFDNLNIHFMTVENYENDNTKLIPVIESEKEKVLEVYNKLIKSKK